MNASYEIEELAFRNFFNKMTLIAQYKAKATDKNRTN
jgi:hypothetical protein